MWPGHFKILACEFEVDVGWEAESFYVVLTVLEFTRFIYLPSTSAITVVDDDDDDDNADAFFLLFLLRQGFT